MKNKKKILIIVAIFLIVAFAIAFTYAYWQITRTQEENEITVACLDISLSNEANDIDLQSQYPITDAEGSKLTPYTFTVTNNCDNDLTYQIALESIGDSTTSVSPSSIKVMLDDNEAALLSNHTSLAPTITDAYDSYKLKHFILYAKGDEGSINNHELRIWIDENAPIDELDKSFTSKISVTVGDKVNTYESVAKDFSGNYIYATKVSKNQHDLEVSIESASLTEEELKYVGVKRVGDNLANINGLVATDETSSPLIDNGDGSYTFTKTSSSRLTPFTDIFIPANTPFQISAYLGSTDNLKDLQIPDLKIQLKSDSQKCVIDEITGEETCSDYSYHTYFLDTQLEEDGYLVSGYITTEYDINDIRLYVSEDTANNASITFKDFQMVIDPTYNRYEYSTYNEQKALATNITTDDSKTIGRVEGLISFSPSMMLSAYVDSSYEGAIDLSDVVINLTYKQGYEYNLSGKNIVNFGDSIFAIGKTTTTIAAYLADLTGANVTKAAFGGSRMSWHSTGSIEFSMHSLSDAITTNDYTLQEEALALREESDDYTETLEVLKNVDFEEVDIITIAFGTNDFTGNRPLDNANNLYDKNSYAGALRYSIETIQAKYPDIEIVLCTPIHRFFQEEGNWISSDDYTRKFTDSVTGKEFTQSLPSFVNKTKDIAKEYGLVVIDNYYRSGINASNREEIFTLNDGVHPNNTGRQMIAENIAKGLYKHFNQ